jgi:FtsH-binding integral membrane protein
MSVLTGIGQGFLITGMMALAYGLFLSVVRMDSDVDGDNRRPGVRWAWNRWRPLAVVIGALVLAGGTAAFQIFETLVAQRLSIRNALTFGTFTEGSYSPWGLLQSFATPLHYIVDASAYLVPLAVLLAVLGVMAAARRKAEPDQRVWFWAGTAIVALILMLGNHTPAYRLLFHVPIFNYFRVPGRHAFEWTFAVSILAAYGWDALGLKPGGASDEIKRQRRRIILALLLLALSIAVAVLWHRDLARIPTTSEDLFYVRSRYPVTHYIWWKALLSVFTVTLLFVSRRITSRQWQVGLMLSMILVACFAEPSVKATRWWWPTLKSAERFTTASPTTRFLKSFPPEQYRIYTRSVLFSEDLVPERRLEPINMTMLHGLHNIAGYEPLILQRYSRALGDVFLDGVTPRPGYPADKSILESQSHVLDILNAGFVVTYSGMSIEPTNFVEQEGIKFGLNFPNVTLKPGETTVLPAVAAPADQLGLVTTLSFSSDIPDGVVIAKARVFTADGRMIERDILAGRDSAEWAHERPDVRAQIRHRLAPVFDSHPTSDQGVEFTYFRYWTRIPIGERTQIARTEIVNVSPQAYITIWKASYYDSVDKFSMPLPHYDLNKWQPVYDQDDVIILRNRNVLPRFWLVAEAEAVEAEEALRRIRGESEHAFDPKRTALLEVRPEHLPALPGGPLPAKALAKLTSYEDHRLQIETQAETPTWLVLSEINYPGWVATVDGVATPIHTTDYILRGITVPAGSHQVELRYTAPQARTGAIISLFTLLLMGGIAFYAKRASVKRVGAGAEVG